MSAKFNTDFASPKLAELVRESREPQKPKELIILVFYVPVGNLSGSRVKEKMELYKENITASTKEMEKGTNYKVQSLVMPTKEKELIECIFPKEKDEVVSEFLQEMKEQKILP